MKPAWLKILIGVGVGASATMTGLTAGLVPAILVGISSGIAAIAALYHAAPGSGQPPTGP